MHQVSSRCLPTTGAVTVRNVWAETCNSRHGMKAKRYCVPTHVAFVMIFSRPCSKTRDGIWKLTLTARWHIEGYHQLGRNRLDQPQYGRLALRHSVVQHRRALYLPERKPQAARTPTTHVDTVVRALANGDAKHRKITKNKHYTNLV